MIDEQDIQTLIKLAQTGDSEAFGQIYDLYAKQLYNFLFSKVQHREVTEEAVQALEDLTPEATVRETINIHLHEIKNSRHKVRLELKLEDTND